MKYDLQLYGKQTVEYFLIPSGPFDGNRVAAAVTDVTSPVFITKSAGEKSFCALKDKELAITALYENGGTLWARGYRLPSKRKSRYRNWEIFNCPAGDLAQA